MRLSPARRRGQRLRSQVPLEEVVAIAEGDGRPAAHGDQRGPEPAGEPAITDHHGNDFHASPFALLLMGEDEVYRDANQPACELLRRRREEIVGLRPADLVATWERESVRPTQLFREAGEDAGIFVFRTGDGGTLTCHVHGVANVAPGLHLATLRPLP